VRTIFLRKEYDVIENNKPVGARLKITGKINTYPTENIRRFFMNCCSHGNSSLWILVAVLVLCNKDGSICGNLFSGCSLPIVIALLYCLYKNGTLSSLLTPSCGCSCNCTCGC